MREWSSQLNRGWHGGHREGEGELVSNEDRASVRKMEKL
jgi:hypothetical protein